MNATEERKTYNGWTNYETWAVKLWMDNEEPSYRYWQSETVAAWDRNEGDEHFTHAERTAFDLADVLKSEHEDALPELSGFAADLLNAAFGEVNWDEIATSLVSDGIESGDLTEESEEDEEN